MHLHLGKVSFTHITWQRSWSLLRGESEKFVNLTHNNNTRVKLSQYMWEQACWIQTLGECALHTNHNDCSILEISGTDLLGKLWIYMNLQPQNCMYLTPDLLRQQLITQSANHMRKTNSTLQTVLVKVYYIIIIFMSYVCCSQTGYRSPFISMRNWGIRLWSQSEMVLMSMWILR